MEKGKILVVDDERVALAAFGRELETAGHDVKSAASGKEAIEITQKENFDIVFTDLVMPDMNGVDVCKGIKEISPNTEVILITGHPSLIEIYHVFFIGAGGRKDIIRKPLAENELEITTQKVLKEIRERRNGK